MRNYLKVYDVKLKTIGPLYIGSGDEIDKKGYIYDKSDNKVYIPNINKMYSYFLKNKLEEKFEDYMINNKKGNFIDWLNNNGVGKDEWKKWTDYILDCREASDIIKNSTVKIKTFVKDSLGEVYIPGSSLKGALRTIILGKELIDNNKSFSKYCSKIDEIDKNHKKYNRKTYLIKEISEIECEVFNKVNRKDVKKTSMVNDIMSGVRVSDSKIISKDNLILCRKIDESVKGTEKSLNILRECIKPETEISFTITVDTTIFKEDIIKLIHTSINSFGENYDKNFNSKYKSGDKLDDTMFYLGGGSGFVSKTVLYPLLSDRKDAVKMVSSVIDKTLNKTLSIQHKHKNDVNLGVSPHTIKKTRYNYEKYSFGLCSINIEEIDL